jgi:glycogen operon protein
MNCNNPIVRNVVLDCLLYWVSAFHVDGFRFDLASILCRDKDGVPMMNPPLLESIANDALLGKTLLIAEAWDAGGLYQVGTFPSYDRWSEWNGMYRDCLRRFMKGGAECLPELIRRIRGSDDLYQHRGPSASINFVTCHDGFTLYDLVSYNEKHNRDNGEDNRDGTNDNQSWNCGAEGETDDPEINALRLRQMKNMLAVLLTSRGIPMLLSGDEFANTQYGNNNAYCQDNEISWLDWGRLKTHGTLYEYVRQLIAFRKAHPVLRADNYNFSQNRTGYPELSFHGTLAWNIDEHAPGLSFAYMYAEDHVKYGTAQDAFIYVAVNAYWEAQRYTLPTLPPGYRWQPALALPECPKISPPENGPSVLPLGPRSTAVLIGVPE